MLIAHATALTPDDEPARKHAAALAAASGAKVVTLHAADEEAVGESLLDELRKLAPTLVVVGTHQRQGLAALVHGSIGELIARNVGAPTLFVQHHARPFIDAEGALVLRKVVVPAGDDDDAKHGHAEAMRFLAFFARGSVPVEIVHAEGPIDDGIVRAAADASLIVMRTRGHDGLGDAIAGSTTEHVVRKATCPVLSIPIARS